MFFSTLILNILSFVLTSDMAEIWKLGCDNDIITEIKDIWDLRDLTLDNYDVNEWESPFLPLRYYEDSVLCMWHIHNAKINQSMWSSNQTRILKALGSIWN